jgi:hypothetical protein
VTQWVLSRRASRREAAWDLYPEMAVAASDKLELAATRAVYRRRAWNAFDKLRHRAIRRLVSVHTTGLGSGGASYAWVQLRSVRTFRQLTILLTVLTLPGYGLAGISHRSCQQQMSSPSHVVALGDCCPGKLDQNTDCNQDGHSPAGKHDPCGACKAGYNCKSPQSYEPTHGLVLLISPAPSAPGIAPPPLLYSHSPDGLWRPPRRI